MKKPIYLDYNATTPIDPRVAEEMIPFITEHFGNPSSSHAYGAVTKKGVEKARKQVAEMLNCGVDEIIFTSGGSESNNYAIQGVARAYREKGNHIITSSVEHPAVTEVCKYLATQGFKISYLPVDKYGMVSPDDLKDAITPETILITIMHANNEIGTIQPIKELADVAKHHGIIFHTDAAQSIGKIPAKVDELGVDLLSVAGHKLYGPKGIGALYIKTGVKLDKLIFGADHEMNKRAGTENVIEIAGLGKACELVKNKKVSSQKHLKKMRDRLEKSLTKEFPDAAVNGHPKFRLPNTLSISFKGIEANVILSELSNVAASAGAACHSDTIDVSPVLEALKLPTNFAMGTIRLSTGRFTTIDEIDEAASEIIKVIKKLQPTEIKETVSVEGEIKLTQFTHGLGCACKLRPQLLEEVLSKMPLPSDKKILVGTESSDDAAVYYLNSKIAVVQTVDFFTPIVDDPFVFGEVAAANSLSDIYAMGATPIFGLNIVGFPSNRLPINVLEQILKGAQKKAEEAGISLIGGHTVDDTEPKYGMAVTGLINPKKIVTNKYAKPGDSLILTKPIGIGILSTALKQGLLDQKQEKKLIKTMISLNKDAAELMVKVGVNACTDITGFGLIGHLLEMMKGSRTSSVIYADHIKFLNGVLDLASAGIIPGGTKDNFDFTFEYVKYNGSVSDTKKLILNDAQTSGGLLISVEQKKSDKLLNSLIQKKIEAVIIGNVIEEDGTKIFVS